MDCTFLGENNSIAYFNSNEILIENSSSALDLLINIKYEYDCHKIILNKTSISEDFFKLSSGMAGEVLQKFVNYHTKLAIVGDFSMYTSKPLKDFIYECNNGHHIFFVNNLEQATQKLNAQN